MKGAQTQINEETKTKHGKENYKIHPSLIFSENKRRYYINEIEQNAIKKKPLEKKKSWKLEV